MDKTIVKAILVAGALTSMAFGTMYAVRRLRENAGGNTSSARSQSGYAAPEPRVHVAPEPEYIPVTIDVVEDDDEGDAE